MINLFDDLPDIGKCPHCGHAGEGLQFAFPDAPDGTIDFERVQAACLSCGVHGDYRASYAEAAQAFRAGEKEVA
ncbi:MAG: hypothetical protein AB7I42_25135 [Bradyrhizobium sp.]|uniref:hypothetical protein n=1 Tax=Bradyrhizobium sp. TaxID=376 RepID=UPI003D117399